MPGTPEKPPLKPNIKYEKAPETPFLWGIHPAIFGFILLILCGLLSGQDFYPENDTALFFAICGGIGGAFLTEIHCADRTQKLIFEWKLYRLERTEYKKYLRALKAYETRQKSLNGQNADDKKPTEN